jgi:regulator of replication initiation timing
MDRTSLIQKLKGVAKGKAGKAVGLLAVAGIALAGGLRWSKHHSAVGHDKKADHAESFVHQIFGTYAQAWQSVQEKAEAIRTAESENERLRLENTHLRLQLEGVQFNCSAKEASNKTQSIEYKLDRETGSTVGRDLASIAYRVPTNLVPAQLYTLGISYFKAREDEKAAVIFTFLTGMDDNDAFKNPRNFLLTGIAWYRLDNFATADRYFDRVLKAPETPENLQTLAHVRLWKALVANRTDKHVKSQFWLTELIDHHPLSIEATWVNSKNPNAHPEAQRGVASDQEE